MPLASFPCETIFSIEGLWRRRVIYSLRRQAAGGRGWPGLGVAGRYRGFVEEKEEQAMEIEGTGSRSAEAFDAGRGKKRPHSPRCDEDSSKSSTIDADDEWLVSSSEEGDDCGNQGMCSPFTVDNSPRASWDHDKQSELVFANPETKRRGPSPIMLFPPFKTGRHLFDSDYNLSDKSEMSLTNVEGCLKECCCLPMDLIQFIDVKIAGYQHSHPGRAKIFGFVAARDRINPLRNYIYRRAIDSCEVVPVNRKTCALQRIKFLLV